MKLTAQRPLLVFATWALLLASFAFSFTGCTLCQPCGELDYPTYGGAWERTRRDGGRVGSVFDPAGARSAVLSDRDSDPEDRSIRTSQGGSGITDPDKRGDEQDANDPDRSDDPRDGETGGDRTPSPSDMDKKTPAPSRDLELEDINLLPGNLLPSDI